MNLDQQLQDLIDHAPQDGSTPQIMERVAPVIKTMAERLRHPQYYVVQTLDQSWVMLTLANRTQSDREKNVIYAFPTLQDVASSPYNVSDPSLIALPVPVTHILFQMLAMTQSDSTIFFETPGDVTIGTEIQRAEMEQLIQEGWQNQADADPQYNIPSDIA
ncbi:hypothetical protein [Myxacorys almedinensis]|uniref:Uncharacterized protein n=1 Tax=Myxacorys almedinensis A TaxID=2690445 RepID=A0A8J8CK78_9CYAN|nr:hypothetical protein [Myxacorys almedinensis]NDJ16370.1 hypothetical protein [Myxacorys almedinensis A]